jgi:hypothetical protein
VNNHEPSVYDRPSFPNGHFPSWYQPPHGLSLTGRKKPVDSPLLPEDKRRTLLTRDNTWVTKMADGINTAPDMVRMSDGGEAERTPEGIKNYQDAKTDEVDIDVPLDAKHVAVGSALGLLGVGLAIGGYRAYKHLKKGDD